MSRNVREAREEKEIKSLIENRHKTEINVRVTKLEAKIQAKEIAAMATD